jgi:hypothetical protein
MKQTNFNINTGFLLTKDNEKLIKHSLTKVNKLVEITQANPLNQDLMKSAQSAYSTPEDERNHKVYYVADLQYCIPQVLTTLLAESRPLKLTFIINLSKFNSQPEEIKTAILASTNQYYVDLSLPAEKTDFLMENIKSPSFQISESKKAGTLYHKTITPQDRQVVEEIISVDEIS